MNGPRFWWREQDEAEGDVALADAPPPPVAQPARPPLKADPARLRVYREQLTRKALLLPRGSARRREVEKQVAKMTADLLRIEIKERR